MLLPVILLHSAPAAEVVVFGDSWAEGSGDELQDALRAAGFGYDVANYGIGGTTATYWNDVAPTALVDAVTANPDARWVWLSILGNDTFGYHASWQGGIAAAANEAELREMLDRVRAAHPDIQVVGFAYDYPNFEQSTECILSAALYFPDLLAAGTFTTYNVNTIFMTEIRDVQARVDADHWLYRAHDLYGTLQGGTPNPWLPSPSSKMSDCIHATSQGYRELHDRLVDLYWGHPDPQAFISGAPLGAVCEGSAVTLVDGSTASDDRRWTRDGAVLGSAPTLAWTATAGSSAVALRAYGGAWHDDDAVTVDTVPPPSPSASADPPRVCAGQSTTLRVVGGSAWSWSPAEGLSDPYAPDPVVTPSATTTLTVTAASAPDCEGQASVTVEVLDLPEVTLTGPDAAQARAWITFSATVAPALPLTWVAPGAEVQPGQGAAEIRFPSAGTWRVEVAATTAEGCAGSEGVDVVVNEAPAEEDTGGGSDQADHDLYSGCACGNTGAGWLPTGLLLGVLGLAGRRRRASGTCAPPWCRTRPTPG